jgi:hypothetical protein
MQPSRTGTAQSKKEEAKDSAGFTWESIEESVGQTWDATKQKAGETRGQAAAAVDFTRGRSYDAAGATQEHSLSVLKQMKQKASNLLGVAQHITNETADTFDTVQDREVTSESTAGATAHKAGAASSPFDQTGSKTSVTEKVQDASESTRRRIRWP